MFVYLHFYFTWFHSILIQPTQGGLLFLDNESSTSPLPLPLPPERGGGGWGFFPALRLSLPLLFLPVVVVKGPCCCCCPGSVVVVLLVLLVLLLLCRFKSPKALQILCTLLVSLAFFLTIKSMIWTHKLTNSSRSFFRAGHPYVRIKKTSCFNCLKGDWDYYIKRFVGSCQFSMLFLPEVKPSSRLLDDSNYNSKGLMTKESHHRLIKKRKYLCVAGRGGDDNF